MIHTSLEGVLGDGENANACLPGRGLNAFEAPCKVKESLLSCNQGEKPILAAFIPDLKFKADMPLPGACPGRMVQEKAFLGALDFLFILC